MPTALSQVQKKHLTLTISVALGSTLIVLGLAGVLLSELWGLHLTPLHSLILNLSGAFTIWGVTTEDPRKAYYVCLMLGIFFAIPKEAIAPRLLEFGTVDHLIHLLLAACFFSLALSWKRYYLRSFN